MGPAAGLDAVKKINICCSLQESNLDCLIIQPEARSLNSMSYTYCQYQNLLCMHTSNCEVMMSTASGWTTLTQFPAREECFSLSQIGFTAHPATYPWVQVTPFVTVKVKVHKTKCRPVSTADVKCACFTSNNFTERGLNKVTTVP